MSVKINLGCGMDYKEDFVNIDINKNNRKDVCADFELDLPFKNDSVDFIFCSHVVEHLKNHRNFLKECSRILKQGSLLEIKSPNYLSLAHRLTFLFSFDYPLRDFNHLRFFSFGMLKDEMEKACFKVIKREKKHWFLPVFLNGESHFVCRKEI